MIFVNVARGGSTKSSQRIYETLAKDQWHARKGSRVLKQREKGNGIGVLLVAFCRSFLFYSQKASMFSFLGESKRICWKKRIDIQNTFERLVKRFSPAFLKETDGNTFESWICYTQNKK